MKSSDARDIVRQAELDRLVDNRADECFKPFHEDQAHLPDTTEGQVLYYQVYHSKP